MSYIKVENLSFEYPSQSKKAIENISISVEEGEFIGVVGDSGAGKTTFLSALCGIIPFMISGDKEGGVYINGKELEEYRSISELSSTISMVLEDPEDQLFNLHVSEEVRWGPENMGMEKEKIIQQSESALDTFGLTGYEDRITTNLSGGEMQRVAIASVYAMQPDIILLDEPTSQLDPIGTEEVFEAIEQLIQEGTTIIMASHKIEELAQYSDRMLYIEEGVATHLEDTREFLIEEGLHRKNIMPPQVTEFGIKMMENGFDRKIPITLDEAASEFGEFIANQSSK